MADDKANNNVEIIKAENVEVIQKHPGGRPLLFNSPEEMQIKIDEYFKSCYREIIDPETKQITYENIRPLTITGLAVALNCDRRTLLNYENKDEFFPAIKQARQRIENYVEESLWKPKVAAGVIFNLKNNFGWVDKSEVETTIKIQDRLEDYFK